MSGYSFEGSNFDGDWEQSGDLAWNEFDWQQYLKRSEREQAKFLSYYNKLKFLPDHLDEIAQRMGWESDDWAPAEESAEGFETPDFSSDETAEADDMEPYTVHKHPVYTVTHALYLHLLKVWEHFLSHNMNALGPKRVADYSASLHAGELNALMALNALDMGDFNLAICHLKNALAAVNHSMGLVQNFMARNPSELRRFQQEVMTCAFDLREVWLRVMRECRDEARRDSDSDDV